ncbi:membrane-spanning 4-domains subfamily A member 15-like isoform X2 [Heptranchias perlo]|uniref:membrane-spanning 4-domains subfamily A member 15-like isoform X2 n=1 Tax=Heptranchias perlo TaxID=212740 RepID=UPI003559C741
MKWARDGGGGEKKHPRSMDVPGIYLLLPQQRELTLRLRKPKSPPLPPGSKPSGSFLLSVGDFDKESDGIGVETAAGGKIGNGEGERGSIEQRGRPREGGQTQFEGESRGMSSPAVTQPTLVVTHVYSSSPRAAGPAVPTGANTAYTQKFLEGEPNALGVAQILIGLVQITFGLPLAIVTNSVSTNLGIPFLIGTVFIVSGAVSIAAEKNPQIKLITIYYMNVIFLIFTLLEFILCIVVSAFVCKATRCCHPYSSMPMILLDSSTADEQ